MPVWNSPLRTGYTVKQDRLQVDLSKPIATRRTEPGSRSAETALDVT
jgi:hypothetical protein